MSAILDLSKSKREYYPEGYHRERLNAVMQSAADLLMAGATAPHLIAKARALKVMGRGLAKAPVTKVGDRPYRKQILKAMAKYPQEFWDRVESVYPYVVNPGKKPSGGLKLGEAKGVAGIPNPPIPYKGKADYGKTYLRFHPHFEGTFGEQLVGHEASHIMSAIPSPSRLDTARHSATLSTLLKKYLPDRAYRLSPTEMVAHKMSSSPFPPLGKRYMKVFDAATKKAIDKATGELVEGAGTDFPIGADDLRFLIKMLGK